MTKNSDSVWFIDLEPFRSPKGHKLMGPYFSREDAEADLSEDQEIVEFTDEDWEEVVSWGFGGV